MFEMMSTIFGLIIATIPIGASWWAWKIRELRREEVLGWARDAIELVQTIALLCSSHGPRIDDEFRETELARLALAVSVTLEQGRLFFKNENADWGGEKEPAYRGYRPVILDQLIVAYLVARDWSILGPDQKYASTIIEGAEKKFLSLAQMEVGRQKTASKYNREGGRGISLSRLIDEQKRFG